MLKNIKLKPTDIQINIKSLNFSVLLYILFSICFLQSRCSFDQISLNTN